MVALGLLALWDIVQYQKRYQINLSIQCRCLGVEFRFKHMYIGAQQNILAVRVHIFNLSQCTTSFLPFNFSAQMCSQPREVKNKSDLLHTPSIFFGPQYQWTQVHFNIQNSTVFSVLNLHSHKLSFYDIFQRLPRTLAAIQSARYAAVQW